MRKRKRVTNWVGSDFLHRSWFTRFRASCGSVPEFRPVGARKLDAQISVAGAEQAHIRAARDELFDQLQVGRVVLYIEQRAQRRVVLNACL